MSAPDQRRRRRRRARPPRTTSRPRRSIPIRSRQLTPEQERYYLAAQWKLMWWKLKRHRIAVVSLGR